MAGGTLIPIPPPGVISATNQSGLILILTALSLCFVLVSFAIRVYIRHPKGLWKLDDNILTAATALSCIQSAVIFGGVHNNLGDEQYATSDVVRKFYFANNFLYIIVLFASKVSMGGLYLRLTKSRPHILMIWTLITACCVWAVASFLFISINSPWESAFAMDFWRWLIIGITDCVTDIALVLMSVYLIKDLQLSMAQKTTVVAAFSTRLFALIPCIVRLYYLNPNVLPDNRNLAISFVIVCAQLQLGYGLMAASVVVLKPFMGVYDKADNPSYMTPHQAYYRDTKDSHNSNTFKMQQLHSSKSSRSTKGKNKETDIGNTLSSTVSDDMSTSDPHGGRRTATPSAISGKGGSRANNKAHSGSHSLARRASLQSHDSRKMIIECRTEWSVKYEDESTREATSGSSDRELWDGPPIAIAR